MKKKKQMVIKKIKIKKKPNKTKNLTCLVLLCIQKTLVLRLKANESLTHKLLNVTGCSEWSAFPTVFLIGWLKCQPAAHSADGIILGVSLYYSRKSTHTAVANTLYVPMIWGMNKAKTIFILFFYKPSV